MLLNAPSTLAGKLDDFEKDTTRDRKTDDDSRTTSSDDGDVEEDCLTGFTNELCADAAGALCAGAAGSAFIALKRGGANSLHRIETPFELYSGDGIPPRRHGEALIPFFRFDIAYQDVESDVTAMDYQFELGYGWIAFFLRSTVYEEKEPDDELEMLQYYGLYRMSINDQVEVDIGIGGIDLSGNESNNGFSTTIPVRYHPSDHYGFEFRPAWSNIKGNSIWDFDLTVLAGWRYASIRAGYRWVHSPNASLNGPEIGISLRW